jgi:hypothetical protein
VIDPQNGRSARRATPRLRSSLVSRREHHGSDLPLTIGIVARGAIFIAAIDELSRARHARFSHTLRHEMRNICRNDIPPPLNRAAPCGLLSCDQSVAGLVPADPARTFARRRSDKTKIKHHGSRFRACLLQSVCQIFGDPHERPVSPSRSTPGRRAAAVVPVVLPMGTLQGDKQTGLRSDVVMSGIADNGQENGMAISTRMTP